MRTCRCLNLGVSFRELDVSGTAEAKPSEPHQLAVAVNLVLLFSRLQAYICPYLHELELMHVVC